MPKSDGHGSCIKCGRQSWGLSLAWRRRTCLPFWSSHGTQLCHLILPPVWLTATPRHS